MLISAISLVACAPTRTLRPFTTDGCSLFPDADAQGAVSWADCCAAHDQAYWRGGTAEERKRADHALRACVLDRTGRNPLATLMYRGVRVGGAPLIPTPFRWGYGWGYGRGYTPLTPDEQQRADELLSDYLLRHPSSDCHHDPS